MLLSMTFAILAHATTICQVVAVNLPSKYVHRDGNLIFPFSPALLSDTHFAEKAGSTQRGNDSVSFIVCRLGVLGAQFRFTQATQFSAFLLTSSIKNTVLGNRWVLEQGTDD